MALVKKKSTIFMNMHILGEPVFHINSDSDIQH